MTLPSHERCRQIIKELAGDPGLSQWESDFVDSNQGRMEFTDRQREIIAGLEEKYEV